MAVRGGDLVADLVFTVAWVDVIRGIDGQVAAIDSRLGIEKRLAAALVLDRESVEAIARDGGKLESDGVRELVVGLTLLDAAAHDHVVRAGQRGGHACRAQSAEKSAGGGGY